MVVEILTKDPNDKVNKDFVKIDFDGRQQFYVFDGEPEDNSLMRNFMGCFMIKDMLEKVYIAGQRGESITFIQREI